MNKILLGIRYLYFYLRGNVYRKLYYDDEYFSGRWFSGNLKGVLSPGWEWVVKNTVENRRLGINKDVTWPVSPLCRVICPQNIEFHPDNLDNFQSFGIYFQAVGRIKIGHGTYIAPNVGIITANHDLNNLDDHADPKDVIIGENCWIGMNSVILPGVCLGDGTVVGAGSVVTKSFEDGKCIIAGNPAKLLRRI